MVGVFVYGTLRPGESNAGIVEPLALSVRPADLHGWTLVASHGGGYPYAVPAADRLVRGVIYTFPTGVAAGVLRRLDFLEGFDEADPQRSHYLRVRQFVQPTAGSARDTEGVIGVDAGALMEVFVYVAGPRIDVSRLELVGPDWTARRRRRRTLAEGV